MTESTRRSLSVPVRSPHIVAFLLSVLISATRIPWKCSANFLWGEDGGSFVTDAICSGAASLVYSVEGVYCFLERVLVFCIVHLAQNNVPLTLSIISLLLQSWCFAYFARSTFRKIIPNDLLRIAVAVTLSVGAGTNEIAGTFIGLSFAFGLLLALFVIENQLSVWKKALLLVLPWSSHMAPALLPLVVLLQRKRRSSVLLILIGNILLSLIAHAAASMLSGHSVTKVSFPGVLPVISSTFGSSLAGMVFAPWLGSGLSTAIFRNAPFAIVLSIVASCVVIYLVLRLPNESEERSTAWGLILSVGFFFLMRSVARSHMYPDLFVNPVPLFSGRNMLLPNVFGVLLFAILSARWFQRFFPLLVLSQITFFFLPSFAPTCAGNWIPWSQSSRQLAELQQGESTQIYFRPFIDGGRAWGRTRFTRTEAGIDCDATSFNRTLLFVHGDESQLSSPDPSVP